jgi:hypothetical protein
MAGGGRGAGGAVRRGRGARAPGAGHFTLTRAAASGGAAPQAPEHQGPLPTPPPAPPLPRARSLGVRSPIAASISASSLASTSGACATLNSAHVSTAAVVSWLPEGARGREAAAGGRGQEGRRGVGRTSSAVCSAETSPQPSSTPLAPSPRDEHGHEVVPQLLVRRVLPAHVHQEAQQRRVLDLGFLGGAGACWFGGQETRAAPPGGLCGTALG